MERQRNLISKILEELGSSSTSFKDLLDSGLIYEWFKTYEYPIKPFELYIEKMLYESRNIPWLYISKYQGLSNWFIKLHFSNLDSYNLVKYQRLDISLLEKICSNKDRTYRIAQYQVLPESFIIKHIDILVSNKCKIDDLVYNQKLSPRLQSFIYNYLVKTAVDSDSRLVSHFINILIHTKKLSSSYIMSKITKPVYLYSKYRVEEIIKNSWSSLSTYQQYSLLVKSKLSEKIISENIGIFSKYSGQILWNQIDNLSEEFIENHLYSNPSAKVAFFKNSDLKSLVLWPGLLKKSKLSERFLSKWVNISDLSSLPWLSKEFILSHKKELFLDQVLIHNTSLDIQTIEELLPMLSNLESFWNILFKRQSYCITQDFIEYHWKDYNYLESVKSSIIKYSGSRLDIDFIERHWRELNPDIVSKYCILPETFIIDHISDFTSKETIPIYQKVSKSFIMEYKDRFSWSKCIDFLYKNGIDLKFILTEL